LDGLLSEYTSEQKKELAEQIVKKWFRKESKRNKERGYSILKLTGKATKMLIKETKEDKLLLAISEELKG